MIKSIVKDAFDEGREIGGEWEDSDAKVVSDMLPMFNIDTVKIRQRKPSGKFGKTFSNIDAVKQYFKNEKIPFNRHSFLIAIYAGWKCGGFYWGVV